MNCLITSATASEIQPFLSGLKSDTNGKAQIDVLISGVGLVASTWSLSHQVQLKRPDLIIQAGIAGSFDPLVKLGTVFVVKQDRIADLGVQEKQEFRSVFDLGLVNQNEFPFKNGWLLNNHPLLKISKLKNVKAISCNEVSTSRQKIIYYKKKFTPVIESMEGAALHYVGLMENIPFLQLRAVSNYIGERNKAKWKLKDSISHLNLELTRLLDRL